MTPQQALQILEMAICTLGPMKNPDNLIAVAQAMQVLRVDINKVCECKEEQE